MAMKAELRAIIASDIKVSIHESEIDIDAYRQGVQVSSETYDVTHIPFEVRSHIMISERRDLH